MLDIFSRVKLISAQAIQDASAFEKFLGDFSMILKDYEIKEMTTDLAICDHSDWDVVRQYIGIKAVEGLSKGSLHQYMDALKMLRNFVQKPLTKVNANDIRCAIAMGMTQRGWHAINANNYRRYWSAFYTWAADEKQIDFNPMRQVKAIKGEKRVRQPFSEEDMERLRNSCADIRERAILEFLFSTACRVSEVADLKLSDVNLPEHFAKVMGKGRKERIVYLNTKAMLYLKEYLKTRTDTIDAVFIGKRFNGKKLLYAIRVSAYEIILRELGKRAGVSHVYPHRFRHTAATLAVRRGMPIEQVKQMLGHEQIQTTMIYAKLNADSLRINHEKYVN